MNLSKFLIYGFLIFENSMTLTKNKLLSKIYSNVLLLVLLFTLSFCISVKQSYALPHEWIGVPKSEYGEQLWDRKSIKRNEDGSFIKCICSKHWENIISDKFFL